MRLVMNCGHPLWPTWVQIHLTPLIGGPPAKIGGDTYVDAALLAVECGGFTSNSWARVWP